MTSVLIQHITTGEREMVLDLEGYDEAEWEVLAIDREPLPNEEWDGAGWVLNQARVDEQEQLAEVGDRARLVRALKRARRRILDLETDVALLRQQATNQIQALDARITTLEGV